MKSLKKKTPKLVNHVAFVLDASGSMQGLVNKMREVLGKQLENLRAEEKSSSIETRVSIYRFGGVVVRERFDIPLADLAYEGHLYQADLGMTALIDATFECVQDLGRIDTKKSDHAFLIYVLTDGQNNIADHSAGALKVKLDSLGDEYTLAVLVPNQQGVHKAKLFGFPAGNIEVWDATSEQGLEDAGYKMSCSTQSYYSMRSSGLKGTKMLFQEPTKTEVKKKLEEVDPGEYETLLVRKYDDGTAIKDFVEKWRKEPYRVGSAYYQITKPEIIQAAKQVAVVEKSTGKMFSGVKARSLLGLPSGEVKVLPASFDKFDVFIQSTSTNRKLVKDTHLIVFK